MLPRIRDCIGRQLLLVAVCNGKNRPGRATMVLLVGLHDADHFERLFDMPITSSLLGRNQLIHELVQRRQCTNRLAPDHREALANTCVPLLVSQLSLLTPRR